MSGRDEGCANPSVRSQGTDRQISQAMTAFTDILRVRWRFTLLSLFLLLCVLFGGSSRPDNLSLLFVRPLAVIYLVTALALPGPRHWVGVRGPLLLLAAFAVTFVIQLVPLPPALWSTLPGHARFLEAAAALGVDQPWRPISVAPDMTFNSLLDLLVPLAVLVGAAGIQPRERTGLIGVALVAMLASAVLGIAQWAGSSSSPLYLFRYTSRDLPVGFFANRNHQAAFLAMAIPLLRAWSALPNMVIPNRRTRNLLAGGGALLVFPVIVASGSRSGFVLAVLGAVAAIIVSPPDLRAVLAKDAASRRRLVIAGAAVAVAVLVAGSVLLFGRALSIIRLGQIDQIEADLRVRYLPVVLAITRDFLPFGSGFGTFDAMFRLYEPFWALKPTYFNRAHNDALELAMTGGVAAIAVLAGFLVFVAARIRSLIGWGWNRSSSIVGKAGLAVITFAFAASLTDYPLRTAAMGMIFTVAVLWVALPPDLAAGGSRGEAPRSHGAGHRRRPVPA
jgi:hypothetical protein